MGRLPTLTGEFRLGSDPELRFTPSGTGLCELVLIATESKRTENGGWEDGDSTGFIKATIWNGKNGGTQAEEAAETFTKGERVLVNGLLYVREYETSEGNRGRSIELKWPTVAPIPGGKPKSQRESTRNGNVPAQGDDPWAKPSQGNDPWATPSSQTEDPPF